MAVDKMGSRFYMQQIACGARKQTRLKADIIKDIQKLIGIELSSLKNVTNQTLEDIYAALHVQKR